jgi:hypothetical protein
VATTDAKLAANRANALLSTGPADTSRTRFNGLAHGLTSKQTVIRGEDQQEYDAWSARLLQDLAPGSPAEAVLADRVIAAAWRLKRFTRVESAFFNERIDASLKDNPQSDPDFALANLFTDPAEMARMRLFLRYQTSVQREYDKASRELQQAKAERVRQSHENAYRDIVLTTPGNPPKAMAASNLGFAPHAAPQCPSPAIGDSPDDQVGEQIAA